MASEIRVNQIQNRSGLTTVTWNDEGLNVVGVVTAIGLTVSGDATIEGNLGVAGTITYEDVARVDAVGLSTYREGLHVGPLAGVALTAYKDGSIRTIGIITATKFVGDGSGVTGAGPSLANGVNDRVVTASSATALNGEANLTFSGSTLGVTGDALISNSGGNAKLKIKRSNTASNTDDYGSILFQSSADNNNVSIGAARESAENDAYLFFSTASGGSLAERLRITKDGSVGVNGAPDFSGFGSNGGGIELDDVNSGFTALKVSHGAADMYLASAGSAAFISTRTNHDIIVEKNSAEVARFTANGLKFANGKGLDFASNTAGGGTATGTVLEDYEEGTYSSSIVSANCTLDNTSGTGYYIKIGNLVNVRGIFSMNTNSGSPSKSGSDNIVQALPYTPKAGGTYTGTMLQQNWNWGGTTSLSHPHYFNPVVADYVCLAASDGIRFYMNKIEYAYERMTNANLHVGFPGYTYIAWNIMYETT